MRWLIVVAAFAVQGRAELRPVFRKFDQIALSMKIQTEIKAGQGRDSKHRLELEVVSEVEKAEGENVVFDVALTRLKVSGTLDGRGVDYEWRKGGAETGDAGAAVRKALEKGWKMTLSGGKGFSAGEGAADFGDVFPVFNPGAFLGFTSPLPHDAAGVGQRWEIKGLVFPYFKAFGLRYSSALDDIRNGSARISSTLTFGSSEPDAEAGFATIVKGSGDASLEYDLKSGRPVRGATALRLTSAQGGLRREVTQVIEFEARK